MYANLDPSLMPPTALLGAVSTGWIVLAVGSLVLAIALIVLMLSRWGQVRPLAKCVVLSVLAHALLLGYASLTHLLDEPAPPRAARPVAVRLIEEDNPGESELAKATPSRPAWQQEPADVPPVELPTPTAERLSLPSDEELARAPIAENVPLKPLPWPEDPMHEDSPQPAPSVPEDLAPQLTPLAAAPLEPGETDRATDSQPESDAPDETPRVVEHAAEHPPASSPDRAHPATRTDLATVTEQADALHAADDQQPAGHHSAGDLPAARESPEVTANEAARKFRASEDPFEVNRSEANRHPAPSMAPASYQLRLQPNRRALVQQQGGSAATEQAVEAALEWLARVQAEDGRWDASQWEAGRADRQQAGLRADTAITGLALLAFLGAGHTQLDGPYQETVRRGLQFLIRSQSPHNGQLAGQAGPFAAMYCHGIATLALSEALALTQDPELVLPLRKAVAYSVSSQHPTTGGWRYRPGDLGDTSQFGWQVMALISAQAAGIQVPPRTFEGMQRWLDRVSTGRFGGLACYRPGQPVSHAMTAQALACRLFLGQRPGPDVDEAAEFLLGQMADSEQVNLYYWYYATLAFHQLQDERWIAWNRVLVARLLALQRLSGPLAGSWDPETVWGRYGGRVYSTALAALSLEVYYRYQPNTPQRVTPPTAGRSGPWRR